ncbi:M20 family metallopeptidase [Pseudoroseomonas cervicalis]|uniref:M20 family metallopeptidase n=1 Tax=Teichococcus cervicalis TaxID=204525 RepID=UPI002789DE5B|nr:M20 family metallopeptidase [Pseudoroseomonas cervicalis]MDQ1077839.1 aminobenzoyl-glutamate utilization protein B [Pseudoroseomonas cervicalis]
MQNAPEIWRHVDAKAPEMIALSDRVWDMPEPLYTEFRSAAEHVAELERQGFRVQQGVAGIPTALLAEAGEGGPVIAILGEYDALPGLSQEAGIAEPKPVEKHNGFGHGCGHNLLGAGAMLAATAVKNWLAEKGIAGRVRYYGCPAEEGGAAKAFMARAGLFADADLAITWHPGHFAEVMPAASLANTRIDFTFTGRSSHAAAAPHLGRSALDAVELMNVGVNYMREHMESGARVHYAYLDAGGIAPNVVQGRAKVRYAVRHPDLRGMAALVERVKKIAQGAALMTETEVEIKVLSAVANLLPNEPLEAAMQAELERLGPPEFDAADRAYAQQIRDTLRPEDLQAAFSAAGLPYAADTPLCDQVVPRGTPRVLALGSTDVGDVSWVLPTVQASGATAAIGTPFHSWQLTAQGKSPHAHKGMVHVAKVMAATAAAALQQPELIAAAKADLARRLGGQPYECPIPAEAGPPLDMAKG